uniref:SURF1-like protein n=1 Tax=Mesocestoides corti TaxID=53468 RepID=A0A5K3ER74_MESCO
HEQCSEQNQKLRTASLLRWWHARKIISQPEKDTTEEQYVMSGVSSVADSDGRRLTCSSGLWSVNKACSVAPVFFILGLVYSTQKTRVQGIWLDEPA